MNFAENYHRLMEEKHSWKGAQKGLIFDRKVFETEQLKEKEKIQREQELEKERKEVCKLKKLLDKNNRRFDKGRHQ